mmetsp:Transcript_21363/g.20667  ORF Transcript_21363/g.20667 Transcript_21363/m.20667 type:complete len:225 (-) Transcript_21363:147-821(-)
MKILVLGDNQTGKTSIIRRFVYNKPPTGYRPTRGIDFHQKTFDISGQPLIVGLWDVIGRAEISSVPKVYFRDAGGILLVCDGKNPNFENLTHWKREIQHKFDCLCTPVPIVLLVNKCDGKNSDVFQINSLLFDQFCIKYHLVGWFRTSSASTDSQLNEAVYALINSILSHDDPRINSDKDAFIKDDETFNLNENKKDSYWDNICYYCDYLIPSLIIPKHNSTYT